MLQNVFSIGRYEFYRRTINSKKIEISFKSMSCVLAAGTLESGPHHHTEQGKDIAAPRSSGTRTRGLASLHFLASDGVSQPDYKDSLRYGM